MTRIDWIVLSRVGSRIGVTVLVFYGLIALVESLGPEPAAATVLVALLHEAQNAPIVRRLLEHMALALRNSAPPVTAAPDGVRPPESLLSHLNHEI